MSYTPTNWTTGDTITATKLNKIEQGIADGGSGVLIVTYDDSTYKLDKTVQEIYDALESGIPAYIAYKYGALPTDFISHKYLAPIIKVYGYQYSDAIRIVVSWTTGSSVSSGTGDYLHAPSVAIFSASSLSEYPSFYKHVYVKSASLEAKGIMY